MLAIVTFAVFSPSIGNEFVEWDDHVNLTTNEHYRGLGWPQIKWMFTAVLMGHYIPVTWLSFALDYLLWGMNPVGYHLTNVVLHAANAVLVFLLATRLLGRTLTADRTLLPLGAAVAALFFALHPLRAESVAWATERRDVLSGFFALLTILLYVKAADAEGRRWRRLFAGALASYALALASKSIVMTLPLVLVLLDVYPLRRLPAAWRRWGDVELRRVWREKIPFFALAGLGAIVSWYAVAANNFFTPGEKYPLLARLGFVFYSLVFYVEKTAFPVNLTPLYELPYRVDLLAPPFLSAIAIAAVGAVGLVAVRRVWPAGLAAAVYYAITIAPVSGLVHAGHQLAHDRYSYLSCLGFALLVGAGPAAVIRLARRGAVRPALASATVVGLGLWLSALALLTVHQVQVWRDTETLWRYAIDADDRCSLCHHNLGNHLLHARRAPADALPHLQRALELRPDRVLLHRNLGLAYAYVGARDRAIESFDEVLRVRPDAADVLVNQGIVFLDSGRPLEAHQRLRLAVMLEKDNATALANLGAVLTELGRPAEALAPIRRAMEIDPTSPHPPLTLGLALTALGEHDAAREQLDRLLAMDDERAPQLARMLGARLVLEW